MSQSPTDEVSTNEAVNYVAAINKLGRLVKSGKSFSGRERNCCFLNIGKDRFANISAVSGLDFIDDARAVASVDWDHDGDLDLWVSNRTGPQLRFLRNDVQTGHHYVSLRLQGRKSNRDAIGARVEVRSKERGARSEDSASVSGNASKLLTKTVRAGDGFLSQSSKWLHFGLGRQATIDRVMVHWPGGDREEFTDLQADGRYRLVEGNGTSEPLPAGKRQLQLSPSELAAPPKSARANVWLASRVPLPRIRYRDFEGNEVELDRGGGGPLLLNLWAGWCGPCLAELGEFARRESELRGHGLNIVALSVDGLGDSRSAEPERLRKLLAGLNYRFDAGLATGQVVDKLELVYAELFHRQVSLPVPASFLIDVEGSLAAVYLGPVNLDRLLSDLKNLSTSGEQRRRLAVPFPGRWYTPPRQVDFSQLAAAYTQAEYVEDSIPLYHSILRRDSNNVHAHNLLAVSLSLRGDTEGAQRHFREALRLNPEFVRSHFNLGLLLAKHGKIDEAAKHFRSAVRIAPDYAEAHLNLAVGLESLNRPEEALLHFREAVRADPREPRARRRLAIALLRQGNLEQGLVHFHEAVRLQPDSARAHNDLADALARRGDVTEAVVHYRRALELRPDWLSPLNNLAWILATSDDHQLRDPDQAVRLAEQASRVSGTPALHLLDTLAAAYASVNRFDKAVRTAQQALKMAQATGTKEQAEQLRQRLRLYKQGQPYREGGKLEKH